MNDLDKLRAALREPPEQPFATPDLGRIMADGTRLRRRRRVVTGAGAAAAAAAVVGIVFGAVALRTPSPPSRPAAQPPVAAAPGPVSTSTTVPPQESRPQGSIIHTGTRYPAGELVFYAYSITEPTLPGVHFGVMAAVQSGGKLDPLYANNEVRGSDRTFGFHTTAGGLDVGGEFVPVFGYFAGPAVRITSTVHGKPVQAHTAKWSEDPSVVVFWFDQAQVPSGAQLTPLAAYAADGTRLTT
ncbi:MAG TPA: hypothetical protein VG674_11575 [Amycolatopsis sp.]|nr:hypothetical protein [Amycolatopsis sp.]